ncbi:ABC transporter permease [Alcanivorax sp. 24]|uniref:ABC transporter permease n=1 Tax=Alcanivorax sp. 24 TaxID=2545266 RepID=UPI001F101182|nr:ABC transporter permease subunit [Alcanivorax sp. 24]
MVVLGAGDAPRIVITFLITFFPIVVSTVTGLMSAPPELIELSRSLGASRWREIRNIRLPFAVPHIFSALRISITLAIIGAVVAEFVAAENGLGFFIAFSTSFFNVSQAFAAGRSTVQVIGPLLEEEAAALHLRFWNHKKD